MESNFNNRDFEQFVKNNADQYRMFPSEKVWKGINNSLHSRRRWYGIGVVLLLLTAGTVTWVMLNPPAVKQIASDIPSATSKTDNNTIDGKLFTQPGFILSSKTRENFFSLPPVNNEIIASPVVSAVISSNSNHLVITVPDLTIQKNSIQLSPVAKNIAGTLMDAPVDINLANQTMDNSLPNIHNSGFASPYTYKEVKDNFPLTIENVVNLFKPKSSRFSYQLYFTPTVSYRKLSENKSQPSSQLINAPIRFAPASSKDINNVVTHKPALGFELGLSAGYQLSRSLLIKAGLQFNVNRYDIKAFSHSGEIATIALNRGDSINTWTNYRNFDGYKSDWLQNLYFSVSAPVGIELKIAGDKKTNIGISGTLQPSYILSDRAFLISTDYKNYAEIPGLIRRWNMSTSLETYVGYSTGKLSWQIGPQVRYQLLSSFQKKYPVRENLFDFGLKVGVMLNH